MKNHLVRQPHAMLLSVTMMVVLFSGIATSSYADDMKNSKYYTMTTSSDHLSFSVLLTDLNNRNT